MGLRSRRRAEVEMYKVKVETYGLFKSEIRQQRREPPLTNSVKDNGMEAFVERKAVSGMICIL